MGLNERLAARKLPSEQYRLRIDHDDVARAELVAARASGDESRIQVAVAALEACYEQVTIVALPPQRFEDLLEDHPPPPGQEGKRLFNAVTFIPALLAACVVSDVTEEGWAEYTTTGAMTRGETADLFNRVWDINNRAPDPQLPKG